MSGQAMRFRRRGMGMVVPALFLSAALEAQAPVAGRVTMLEAEDRSARDLSQAVVWLAGPAALPASPATVEVATEGKKFLPRLVVVPRGASVAFPNHDPFNHNVFSLSPEGPFDLGLYGRGTAKGATFPAPGIIRVYCNVHAEMRAVLVVLETALYTQPGADGAFRFAAVPPGEYLLHAWHERAGEVTLPVKVGPGALEGIELTLDARGYRFVQHRDKHGRPYSSRGGRRY